MAIIRALFRKIMELFFRFSEKTEKISPPSPSRYVPVVIRKCRIPLLTKCPHDSPLSCFFRIVLYTVQQIKRKCKAPFSNKFRTIKLKADVCNVLLIFISINQQLLSFSALYIDLRRKCKTPN